MRRLIPIPAAADTESGVADWYDRGQPEGRWLRSNMIQTLDGAATGADGMSRSLSGPADRLVLRALRGISDAVVVGAGTVRAEGYAPLRTAAGMVRWRRDRGLAEHPRLVIVSASGMVADLEGTLAACPARPLLVTGVTGAARAGATPAEVVVVDEQAGGVDTSQMLAALTDRGLRRLLTEGGPALLSALLAADLVDEFCLTTAPLLVGAGSSTLRILRGPPGPAPRAFDLVGLAEADGFLFAAYRRPGGS